MSIQPMQDYSPTLADIVAGNIRAEAARAGFNQSSFARAIGIKQQIVNTRWNGRTPWTINELAAVGAVLQISVLSLFDGVESVEIAEPPLGGSHLRGLRRARRDSNPQPSGWYPMKSEGVVDLSVERARRRVA